VPRGRLSKNARVADDAKTVTNITMARDLCRGGAVGWKITRDSVLIRDRGTPCSRCGTPVRWDLPGNHSSGKGPSIEHLGTQVADVVGMTKGAARKLLHDQSHLAVSHFTCNARDGRGRDRPPTETVDELTTKRIAPLPPLELYRKPQTGFVTPDGRTIYRGPNYGQEEYETECAQNRKYEKEYVSECLMLHIKPWPALHDEAERQRRIAGLLAA
jgi:hypothetical protein